MEYPILNLPLDETGQAETHKRDETHPVSAEKSYLVYPEIGPYYLDSMDIYDQNNTLLKKGIDWEPFLQYRDATVELGQAVYRLLVIKNPSVTSARLVHQTVGGVYMNSNIAFEVLLQWFIEKNNTVYWDDIIKPDGLAKAGPHPHHVEDLMGTQDVVQAILAVNTTLAEWLSQRGFEISDVNNLEQTLTGLSEKDGDIEQSLSTLNQGLQTVNQTVTTQEETQTSQGQTLSTHGESINSQGESIQTLTQNLSSLSETLDQLSNSHGELSNTVGEIQTTIQQIQAKVAENAGAVITVTATKTITRTTKLTEIDRTGVNNLTIEFDVTTFKGGDGIVVRIPHPDCGVTTFTALNAAKIVTLTGAETSTTSLTGSGKLYLRALGEVDGVHKLKIMELV